MTHSRMLHADLVIPEGLSRASHHHVLRRCVSACTKTPMIEVQSEAFRPYEGCDGFPKLFWQKHVLNQYEGLRRFEQTPSGVGRADSERGSCGLGQSWKDSCTRKRAAPFRIHALQAKCWKPLCNQGHHRFQVRCRRCAACCRTACIQGRPMLFQILQVRENSFVAVDWPETPPWETGDICLFLTEDNPL